jgi:preprotein translocase subunit SecA
MFGRRYSEGLHQAIEAKEGVSVEKESKTLATITFQNYFRLYGKLSGMTGTALTEEEEFNTIYNLDIVEIPTNRPLIRKDYPDVVYKNDIGKNRAIIEQIVECHEKGQPVLVGTVSVEKSEYLSSLLKKRGIKHNVLNAKNHEREAEIVAQAGKFGAVTISTNMAGRGTDIMLGGNPEFMAKSDMRKAEIPDEIIAEATGFAETDDEEILNAREMFSRLMEEHKAVTSAEAEKVREVGGLFILGTERHESRRIDNQLRGRAGRQGDPGESRFYLAMTDDIMRLFGAERIMAMMDTLKIDDDTPIDQRILSDAIEKAQMRVESRNFQSRKNVLEYDDVMNKQRELIYEQRRMVLDGENVKGYIQSMVTDVIKSEVNSVLHGGKLETQEQLDEIIKPFAGVFLLPGGYKLEANGVSSEKLAESLNNIAMQVYEAKEKNLGLIPETDIPVMRELERVILLRVVDEYWMDHIDAMHDLRQGIGLRAYGNISPVDAYKQEGFDMFEAMINGIKEETTRRVYIARIRTQENLERQSVARERETQNVGGPAKKQPVRTAKKKIGRNDPCPCGKLRPNGLPMKYKNCCGRLPGVQSEGDN